MEQINGETSNILQYGLKFEPNQFYMKILSLYYLSKS